LRHEIKDIAKGLGWNSKAVKAGTQRRLRLELKDIAKG
jgi:hypothetical protein